MVLTVGLLALLASPAIGVPRARTTRNLSIHDRGNLRFVAENGDQLMEAGQAKGTLPGTVHASLTIGSSTVRVGFTLYLHDGTITGHGTASFNPGKGEYASFGGPIAVSHGSGAYAHVTGTGQAYGSINRNTENAVVQVIGQLRI